MKRSILPIIAALLFAALAIRALSAQSCGSCKPSRYGVVPSTALTSTYTVCILSNEHGTFSQPEKDAIEAGFNYWNNSFASSGVPTHFNKIERTAPDTCPSDSIELKPVPGTDLVDSGRFAETTTNPDPKDSFIHINKDFLGNGSLATVDNWKTMAAHEIGHVLDLADQTGEGCCTYTIMCLGYPEFGSIRCGDSATINDRIQGSTSTQYEPGDSDCEDGWKVYDVTIIYCFTPQGWEQCGYDSMFQGCYYGLLPE